MAENEKLLRALKEGKVELLENVSCDEAALADDSIQVALRRAAERVVSHRLNYRATIQKAVELGVPCDIWTAARAGLLDVVKKHIADDASLLDAEDDRQWKDCASAICIDLRGMRRRAICNSEFSSASNSHEPHNVRVIGAASPVCR